MTAQRNIDLRFILDADDDGAVVGSPKLEAGGLNQYSGNGALGS